MHRRGVVVVPEMRRPAVGELPGMHERDSGRQPAACAAHVVDAEYRDTITRCHELSWLGPDLAEKRPRPGHEGSDFGTAFLSTAEPVIVHPVRVRPVDVVREHVEGGIDVAAA